jgi:anti-sigma B factor antagonist
VQTSNKVTQHQLQGASSRPVIALRYTGDISSASRDAVVGSYEALDKTTNASVLLDFKGVDYLNSSGIALVIQVLMASAKLKQTVAICGLTPHFTKVFTMVGITKFANLHADEPAALAAL